VLHQIGVGALGPVFRTYEPTRDRLVAVKVFRLDVTPEVARSLADELAKAADAGLFHPSIVEPVAAGIEGTVAYRAEEYVAAESLDVAMRHYAPATVDKVLPFITQLASALDFARAAGVGHGALHPRDIFVTPDEARATGFGVVDALERLELRAPVRRPYSPPERIAGEAWGTQADVFSLGVIAFELLTGRRPSGLGDDMGPLTGATLGDRADEVRAVLARAMHASPSARYATASAFSAALAAAAGVSEMTVSLSDSSLGRPTSSAKPAPQTTQAVPPAPVAPATDVPPIASAADPVRDVVEDHALNDFATEPDVPSPMDSPREAVRKVIAAREARKRQIRKRPADESSMSAVVPLPAQEGESVPVAGLPVTGVLFDKDRVDRPSAAPPAELRSVELDEVTLGEQGTQEAPLESLPLASVPFKEELPAAAVTFKEELPAAAVTIKQEESTEAAPPRAHALDDAEEVPLLEAVDLAPPVRDFPDRVVAVDEFRAREAASPKPDRSWPRVAEPSLLDRPERVATSRTSGSATGLGLGSLSPSLINDTSVPDIPPSVLEEAAADRRRPVMLERALILGLGLVLGFAAGQFRREMVPTAPSTTAAPRLAEGQAATTGSGTAVASETTVSVPPPANATATSNERPPAVPSPAVTAPVKAPVPPPVPRVKPVTSGRLIVTSNPAKAGVTINGKWSGRTPLTLDNLKFGKYEVRVVEKGFEVARERFTLSESAASRTVDVALRRVPADKRASVPEPRPAQSTAAAAPSKPPVAATGAIFVDSRPRGARVFVDGKEVGVTPLTLAAQPVGSHVVRLELADHQSVTATTQVVGQKTASVTLSLDRVK
jgi:serine/threonine protein kinase